ncbi:MAG: hypothetical protein Devi2KO_40850 [Devosia indica]
MKKLTPPTGVFEKQNQKKKKQSESLSYGTDVQTPSCSFSSLIGF